MLAQTTELRLEEPQVPDAPALATIDCIYEDSRGFIWLGCYSGLYLFDGYSMTPFYNDPNDPRSISDNKIKKLLEDRQGNIWVGMQLGLNYFDVRKKTFQRYQGKQRYGIGDVEIYDLKEDAKGNIWLAAADGLYKKETGQAAFKKYFPETDISTVNGIELTERGLYFCSSPGLFYMDFGTGKIKPVPAAGPLYAGVQNERICLQQDGSGTIWMGTGRGLFSCTSSSGAGIAAHPAFQNESVFFVSKENTINELWISTAAGLSVIDTRTGHCNKNIPLEKDGIFVEPEGFSQICHTAAGITWLSSVARHLYKADRRKLRFGHVPVNLMEHLNSAARKLFELYEYSPGVLLVPQKNGPIFLNIRTRQTAPFPYRPDYNLRGWQEGIVCFLEEQNGQLWIGTGGGIFLFDKQAKRFQNPESRSPGFSALRGISVRKMHRDKKNRLWVATWYKGIFRIDLKTGAFARYNDSARDEVRKTAFGRSILETRAGDLWVGTRGGLLKYSETADTFQIFRKIDNDPLSMSESTAFCIYEGPEGDIWCGTYGGGLNKLDVKTGTFRHYTTANGLLNNNVFCLLPDRKNDLWMMGFEGISVFRPATDSFHVITQQQGLLNKEYDGFLYGKSPYSGQFFFGGKKGIDFFDPDSIALSDYRPQVRITDFKLFNSSVPIGSDGGPSGGFFLPEDISFVKEITLRHDQNVLTFDYVALDFSAPRAIRYAYRLTGFDADWQQIGTKRSVTFTNLDPGTYTFQVKSTNADGVWNSETASVTLRVLAPWWQTTWFRSLAFLSLAALITLLYRYRIRQIRDRADLNRRISEAKIEALRSQMNPHFIFNCLSSLKSYVEKNETEKASLHLSKFAKLLRDVLDQSRSDVISLEEELNTLQRYVQLEQIRYKNFDFRMDIQPEVPVRELRIPPLIIQPYVENAIWHGLQYKTVGTGLLQVKVSMEKNDCRITVEDNGIGRTASMEHKKNELTLHQYHALNVTAERMDLFKRKFDNNARIDITDGTDTDGNAGGTRVTLTFGME